MYNCRDIIPTRKFHTLILLFSLFSICIFSSCEWNSKSVDNDYFTTSFDDLVFWSRNPMISDEISRSGHFCTYVDAIHPSSQGFEMSMSHAKNMGYEKVEVSAWILRPEQNNYALLVSSIARPDSELVKIKTKDVRHDCPRTSSWTKVEMKFDLPKHLPGELKLRIYLWTPTGDKVFMDDVSVHFIR